MGKQKVFCKTDISIPQGARHYDSGRAIVLPSETHCRINTIITFDRNPSSVRSFDFARWYGSGIDAITFACQRQIERFLAGQEGEVTSSTVIAYCRTHLKNFLNYLLLCATAMKRELTLDDVNRTMIDGFLGHLSKQEKSYASQKTIYSGVKSVLTALGRRGLIELISTGDNSTFPLNPYPNSNRKSKGETPLPRRQRQALTAGLKQAIMPIWHDGAQLTAELVAYSLLVVALYTGRNTTPLLELARNCLHAHPRENTVFLLLWKRRGNNSSKVALHTEGKVAGGVESTPAVKANVERLINRVLTLSKPLCVIAQDDLKDRVWLYQVRGDANQVSALTVSSLARAICKLVKDYKLTDTDGLPLRINVSRLRKTFANRIYELLDGDLATTAIALGNTPQVADRNYLVPGEGAIRNWRFMGEILVQELLTRTIGATFHPTPMGRCSDPVSGQYAPKQAGAVCFSFLNCLRCKHYAVTEDDLYRLFSFYFHVLAERSSMDKRRWAREYSHIPRLIDGYIVAEGVRRGAFKPKAVEAARERARVAPHPFWSSDMIEALERFS